MKRAVSPVLALILLQSPIWGQELSPARSVVRIAVTGESNLKSNFIESLKDTAREARLSIEIVPRSDAALQYTVIVAQETTIGSAAAAVIALDREGDVAASVVRSGRFSGRGALNACAKELVKKILVLAR